jgi:DNA invertase Pin-like site-specific DNA recombinase
LHFTPTQRDSGLSDKDSDKRQRAAIEAFAKRAGFAIVDEYYDKAVSGADRIDQRRGFAEMLQRLAANGAKTIIVESPDRFARVPVRPKAD